MKNVESGCFGNSPAVNVFKRQFQSEFTIFDHSPDAEAIELFRLYNLCAKNRLKWGCDASVFLLIYKSSGSIIKIARLTSLARVKSLVANVTYI